MTKYSQKIEIITQATIKVHWNWNLVKSHTYASKQKPFSTKYVQDD